MTILTFGNLYVVRTCPRFLNRGLQTIHEQKAKTCEYDAQIVSCCLPLEWLLRKVETSQKFNITLWKKGLIFYFPQTLASQIFQVYIEFLILGGYYIKFSYLLLFHGKIIEKSKCLKTSSFQKFRLIAFVFGCIVSPDQGVNVVKI